VISKDCSNWWNDYIGLPFVEKGRDERGFDCWGLVRHIYINRLDIYLPSYSESYEKVTDYSAVSEKIKKESEQWLLVDSPKEYDVILLRVNGLPMHVGIITRPNHMLHCMLNVGVIHEKYTGLRWKDKVLGYGRCK
jgi:cell wall-associated NlpC family hydrolase